MSREKAESLHLRKSQLPLDQGKVDAQQELLIEQAKAKPTLEANVAALDDDKVQVRRAENLPPKLAPLEPRSDGRDNPTVIGRRPPQAKKSSSRAGLLILALLFGTVVIVFAIWKVLSGSPIEGTPPEVTATVPSVPVTSTTLPMVPPTAPLTAETSDPIPSPSVSATSSASPAVSTTPSGKPTASSKPTSSGTPTVKPSSSGIWILRDDPPSPSTP